MVGLARKFKDKPFHVIASHCQAGDKDATLKFLKSSGWDEEITNLTIMSRTDYPDDIEITHVPYYLIFDHTGKLRHHHMAGPYHGGNGHKYQEEVANLLKEVPQKRVAKNPALSELRQWMNAQGRIIEASLLGVNDDKAKFRMRNGRTYEYPLEKLSGESRKEIEELAEDHPR